MLYGLVIMRLELTGLYPLQFEEARHVRVTVSYNMTRVLLRSSSSMSVLLQYSI